MPLLIPVITILMLLMIVPCTNSCLARFCSAHVNKLQHAVPVEQGYIKLPPTMENITHPQVHTTIRTLRLESSKAGRPNALPVQPGSSQRELDTHIHKELVLPFLQWGTLNSQNREKESKIVVAKRQRREKPTKIEQRNVRGSEWEYRVKQIVLLASPVYLGRAQGEEEKHKKRSQN